MGGGVVGRNREIPVPAVVVPTKLDIACTRNFYCNSSNCQPVYIKGYAQHSYREIKSKLFDASNRPLKIQFWGDSIQAQVECDMRQWTHENSKCNSTVGYSPEEWSKSCIPTTVSSEYLQVGCPWYNCTPSIGWEGLIRRAKTADVIVFNIGAHYEGGIDDDSLPYQKRDIAFDVDIDRYYSVLQTFMTLESKVLLVRGPSPTHFDTEDGIPDRGIENATQILNEIWKRNNFQYACVPLRKVPDVIRRQKQGLLSLVNRLKHSNMTDATSTVDFLDVYDLTRDRHMEHSDSRKVIMDCKHYCQNCGVYRAWNSIVADYITSLERFIELSGEEEHENGFLSIENNCTTDAAQGPPHIEDSCHDDDDKLTSIAKNMNCSSFLGNVQSSLISGPCNAVMEVDVCGVEIRLKSVCRKSCGACTTDKK